MTRLHHIQVTVAPGATANVVGFYESLGLTPIAKPVADGIQASGAWFETSSGGQLHVSEREGATPSGDRHFGLVVDGYDELITHLLQAGHRVDERPAVLGTRRAFSWDPEGNAVELIENAGGFA